MTVYNFGSINIDYVYLVDNFVQPGETITSKAFHRLLGGKGSNQSIALAKAGIKVTHIGYICESDSWILDNLNKFGVFTDKISTSKMPTGHAIIQVNKDAENSIILYPGANHSFTQEKIDEVLAQASSDDWVLIQNETNLIEYIVAKAKSKNIRVAYNPAPMNKTLTLSLLKNIDFLILNETEIETLTGCKSVTEAKEQLLSDFPELACFLTLGKNGVVFFSASQTCEQEAFAVEAADTTAAGDTFTGYCIASLINNCSIEETLKNSCGAAGLCVTRFGAANSIPAKNEVEEFLSKQVG
jgi:ribokinase